MSTIQVGLHERAYFELERRASMHGRSMESEAEEVLLRGLEIGVEPRTPCPCGVYMVWDDADHGHCPSCSATIHRLAHHCAEGWICEAHPERGWPHDDCAGAGMLCSVPAHSGMATP